MGKSYKDRPDKFHGQLNPKKKKKKGNPKPFESQENENWRDKLNSTEDWDR